MTEPEITARGPKSTETRMRLRYGVNESDGWWYFAQGPQRERIWARLREIDTRMLRLPFKDEVATYMVSEIDEGTENRAVESACDGTLTLETISITDKSYSASHPDQGIGQLQQA